MNCRKFKKIFSLYIDNKLSKKDAFSMESHIKTCAYCKNYQEKYSRLSAFLKTTDYKNPPEYIWTRIESYLSKKNQETNFFFNPVFYKAVFVGMILVVVFLSINDKVRFNRFKYNNVNKYAVEYIDYLASGEVIENEVFYDSQEPEEGLMFLEDFINDSENL